MPPKGGGKRAKREPVRDEEEAELEEFPVHAGDGYEVPLVCRDASEYYSVMGVLFWSHYNSLEAGITRFFDTKEACVLRLVHSEFRDAVSATPWHDLRTVIKGSVASWRECFGLRAQAANVSERSNLVNADFVHFRGLAALDMSFTSGFTDAAYANLCGICCLTMNGSAVSAGAFAHLKGVQELDMLGCDPASTTSAFESLQGVRSLATLKTIESPIMLAIVAGDVPECKRLLAARAFNSVSWLHAGVLFHDVPAPSTSDKVIASACLELLNVGIELDSAGIALEAAFALNVFISSINGAAKANRIDCCIAVGGVAALVTAIKSHCMDSFTCSIACVPLSSFASVFDGAEACLAAGAIPTIVALHKKHHTLEKAGVLVSLCMCGALAEMSNSIPGATSCISSGGVPQMVLALRLHASHASVCAVASRALRIISSFAPGVAACLSADAVPHLLAAFERHPEAREHAKAALHNLGIDV